MTLLGAVSGGGREEENHLLSSSCISSQKRKHNQETIGFGNNNKNNITTPMMTYFPTDKNAITAITSTPPPTKEVEEEGCYCSMSSGSSSNEKNSMMMMTTMEEGELQSELEEMKNIMSSLYKSIGFQPVEIHRIIQNHYHRQEEIAQDKTTTKMTTFSKVEVDDDKEEDLLSNEMKEMSHIISSLHRMIGFQPVTITSSSMHSTTTFNMKEEKDEEDYDNESTTVASFQEFQEEEEEDHDEEDDSNRSESNISKTEKDNDDDELTQASSCCSLLPGRLETYMSSDIRDFLRQQQLEEEEDHYYHDKQTHQVIDHPDDELSCFEYNTNRRKATAVVEEKSKLLQREQLHVKKQRLANLKAKRVARYRANKSSSSSSSSSIQ